MKEKLKTTKKSLAGLMLAALVFGGIGISALTAHADDNTNNNSTVRVTIAKYIDGAQATSTLANNSTFNMNANWNANNIGSGSGHYTLDATGVTPYQAQTTAMSSGATYSTNEVMDSTTGTDCSANTPFALVGYTSGDTLAAAAAATPSTTAPALSNIISDKFVIVWNHSCSSSTNTSSPSTTEAATAITATDATLNGMNGNNAASGESFWVSLNPFSTASTTLPANVYSTPVLPGVAANTSFSASLSSVTSLPQITAGTTYYFVAWTDVNGTWHPGQVLNFSTTGGNSGSLNGSVTGGTTPVALQVTSISTVKGNATADDTFANGLKYTFNITVPMNETHLAMKFGDWTMNGDSSTTIPVANNLRISSPQADNNGATVLITAANTYSPVLNLTSDLDSTTPGRQVQVTVEAAIPANSVNGSYSTTYGVQTN